MVDATEICLVPTESSKNFRYWEQEELLEISLYKIKNDRNI